MPRVARASGSQDKSAIRPMLAMVAGCQKSTRMCAMRTERSWTVLHCPDANGASQARLCSLTDSGADADAKGWRGWCVRRKSAALSLIHISEPTRQAEISYAVFCLKK